MNIVAFILILVAAALFAVEFFRSQWQNLIALGLCLLSVGFLFEFAAKSHTVHF